jgi:hypothetical protein
MKLQSVVPLPLFLKYKSVTKLTNRMILKNTKKFFHAHAVMEKALQLC